VERSYYDLNSDFGIYCANVEIGTIAAKSFKNKVYVSTVYQPPKNPVAQSPDFNMTDPFHLWDYIAATGAWDFFAQWSSSAPSSTSRYSTISQGSVPAYSPTPEDLAFGNLLRQQFYDFIINGAVSNGMTPIDSAAGFPNNVNIAVQGDDTRSAQVTNQQNYRIDYCNLLKTVGLAPSPTGPIDDSRFWWIN